MINSFDPIAIYAAIVATGALFLEIRRWSESGPRIMMTLMPEAKMFGGQREDNNTYLVLNATNTGNLPTTVTHMVLRDYGNFWNSIRDRPTWSAFIKEPEPKGMDKLTYNFLEPGKTWMGIAISDDKLAQRSREGRLYCGIVCSHQSKPILTRVKIEKPNIDDEVL